MTDVPRDGIDVGPEALRLLTLKQVAALWGVSVRTVERLVSAELRNPGSGLPSVLLGPQQRRVFPEDVTEFRNRLRDRRAGAA